MKNSLRRADGSVAFDPSIKAQILYDVFQGKQHYQNLDLPPPCFSSED